MGNLDAKHVIPIKEKKGNKKLPADRASV
jgi:hypothetical protein